MAYHKELNWQEIQAAYESGKTIRDLQKIYGVSSLSIKKAKQRGEFSARTASETARRKRLLSSSNDELLAIESGLKRCVLCKGYKATTEFNKHNHRKDGLQTQCKECTRKRFRAYYQANTNKHKQETIKRSKRQKENNRQFIIDYLSKHPCVDCGETDPVVLEFDHMANKSHNISKMVGSGFSINSIEREIDKCQVRCANCHRRKTAKDYNWFYGRLSAK